MTKERFSILAAITGNCIFGFTFLFSKICLDYVNPSLLLAIRFDISFIILSVLVMFKIIKIDLKGKDVKGLIVLGILQPVIYFLCENNGLRFTPSSIGGIIIAMIPIVNFFTGYFILKEKFSMKQFLWAIVSVLGVILISLSGSDSGNVQMIGILLLLGAVLSGALFTTLSRKYNHFNPIERTYVMFFVGAIWFTLMAIFDYSGFYKPIDSTFVLSMIYLSTISAIGGFLLINMSVQYLPVRQATSFASLTSIISVVAGVLVLHESITLIQLVGIVIILFGVYKVNVS